MEDREFEELKFKFDQHKQLDDKFSQNAGIFDKQLFTFNLGLMTLAFFTINKALDYNIYLLWYFVLFLATLFCVSSSMILMRTYARSRQILKIQKELIFDFNKDKSDFCDKLDLQNQKGNVLSYLLCVFGCFTIILTIFLAIFTVDFKKEKEVSNIGTIYCNMADTLKDTFQGLDTKSFAQQTQKHPQFVEYSEAGQSFAQTAQTIAEMQVKNVASPKPQKPQPESTIKQPSNTQ